MPSVCPRCSGEFECGVDTGACWCADVGVHPTSRAALREFYEGCLCRECLMAIDAKRPRPPTVRAFLAAQLRRRRG